MKNCEQVTIGETTIVLVNGKIVIEDKICKQIAEFVLR